MENRADGNDRVALQVGSIGNNSRDRKPHKEDHEVDVAVDNVNTREGNAQVGVQVDRVDGGVVFD